MNKIGLFSLLLIASINLIAQDISVIELDEEDIDREVERIIIQSENRGEPMDDSLLENLRANVREGMIMRRLLVSLALYRGWEPTEEEIDKALAQRRGGYPDGEWDEVLATQGYTRDEFRRITEESLMIDKVLKAEVWEGITVSEQEAKTYYEEHREDFTSDHGIIPFREVEELIRNNLIAAKGREETARFMDELYSRAVFIDKE